MNFVGPNFDCTSRQVNLAGRHAFFDAWLVFMVVTVAVRADHPATTRLSYDDCDEAALSYVNYLIIDWEHVGALDKAFSQSISWYFFVNIVSYVFSLAEQLTAPGQHDSAARSGASLNVINAVLRLSKVVE